jgi:hypothetical protein
MEVSTRAAASTSIGEVATRNHQQSESDDQYESASRTFKNPNHCHAITFLFYRINKCQTVKFELASIERRVDDPAAPTGVVLNPPKPVTGVAVRSSAVLATGANRPTWRAAPRRASLLSREAQAPSPDSGREVIRKSRAGTDTRERSAGCPQAG